MVSSNELNLPSQSLFGHDVQNSVQIGDAIYILFVCVVQQCLRIIALDPVRVVVVCAVIVRVASAAFGSFSVNLERQQRRSRGTCPGPRHGTC